MAPMIDMVFLLLVFFMTVSTLAQDERVPLAALPESERAKIPEESAGRGNISLKYADDGSGRIELYVGPTLVENLQVIQTRLREGLAANPDLEINVRSTPDMPFREIKRVLTACAEAGAHKIVYATHQAR